MTSSIGFQSDPQLMGFGSVNPTPCRKAVCVKKLPANERGLQKKAKHPEEGIRACSGS